ncbi:MAG TPA: ABC transporter ATP-binding protein [Burkholderiales bacterium]
MNALVADNVGKAFRAYRSEWHRLGRWLGIPAVPAEENWVLRHVSFAIARGQALGIVGPNGAGKSTLLKIVTGTMRATEGTVQAAGRIAAILELGMGFNPELTARQNVRHAAGLMGIAPAEIEAAMPEIERFAEIGDYFDQPMRTHSSGMQVRVAFAVATAWRPEVLIVDEALSVGDAYFQHKSFDRIREFQRQGTSLLIASHDRAAILNLCDRAVLLDRGRVLKDGVPEEVLDFYNALIAERESRTVAVERLRDGRARTVSGTGEACVEEIALYDSNGRTTEQIDVGETVELHVRVGVRRPVPTLVLGFGIKDRLGQMIYGTNTWHTGQVIERPQPGEEYRFVIAFRANLGVGSYSIVTALHARDTHVTGNYEWRDLALVFSVVNREKTQFEGCNWLEAKITYERQQRRILQSV